jgi:uncharacterized protein (TIGR03437 family)
VQKARGIGMCGFCDRSTSDILVPPMFSRICLGLILCSVAGLTQPTVGGVSNGASFQPNISPGSLISIFGTNLAPTTVQASEVPLPTMLSGTSVTIGGIQAPLYFVSATQINAQVPFELQQPYGNGEKALVVTNQARASSAFPLSLQPDAPAIFTTTSNGQGGPLLIDATFHIVDTPAPGQTVILYATGLGPTVPPLATGAGGNAQEPFSRLQAPPAVFVGERPAEVTFAGMAPGLVGVYQLNFVMPSQPLLSDHLYIGVPGAGQQLSYASNITNLPGPASLNVANVSASISAVYPSSTSLVTYSPALLVVKLNVKFDILPGAQPFSLLATADGLAPNESVKIDFNPATSTFSGTASSPTAQARAWNFFGEDFSLIDLLTGQPSPGNIIPLSRVDPAAVAALSTVPLASVFAAGSPIGQVGLTGAASAGSTFLLNDSTNSALSTFAGYFSVYASSYISVPFTMVKLYLDGSLVGTATVTFQTP